MLCLEQWSEHPCDVQHSDAVALGASDTVFINPEEGEAECDEAFKMLKTDLHMMIRDEIRNYIEERVRPDLRLEVAALVGSRSEINTAALSEQQPEILNAVDEQAVQNSVSSKLGDVVGNPEEHGPSQGDDENAASIANKGPSSGPNPQLSNPVVHSETNPSTESSAVNWRKTHVRLDGLRYEFKETVWDVLVFVRLGMMYWSDELLVYLVGFLNITVQWLFILIVSQSMIGGGVDWTKSEIVGDMLDWRVKFAHDPRYADKFSDVSLAAAVCEKKSMNMEGIQQANIYLEVDEYLEPLQGFASGELLCMLSILLWAFTCFQEFMTCTTLLQGVWLNVYDSGSSAFSGFRRLLSARSSVFIKSPSLVAVAEEVHKKSIVLNISFRRACLVTMFAIIPRCLVVASLGYVGVLFLMQTIVLEDLILNAVALEVVLHVDEMMYDLFAPQHCKRVVSTTYPLRLAKIPAAVDSAVPYVKIIAAGTLVALIRAIFLQPILKNLQDTQEVMCGGNKDFLFVEVAKGPVLAGVPTGKQEMSRKDYNYLAVLQRTGLNVKEADSVRGTSKLYLDSDQPNPLFPVPNVVTAQDYTPLQIVNLAGAVLLTSYGVECNDMYWERASSHSQYALRSALVTVTGVPGNLLLPPVNISFACMALRNQSLCNSNTTTGKWVRFFCPKECGCIDPFSGQIFSSVEQGIPIVCLSGDFRNVLNSASTPCTDRPTGDPAFKVYADSCAQFIYATILKMENGNVTRTDAFVRDQIEPVASLGCQYASTLRLYTNGVSGAVFPMNVVLCSPDMLEAIFGNRDANGRSLRYLCPVSCGCSSTVRAKIATHGTEINGKVLYYENCMRSCVA